MPPAQVLADDKPEANPPIIHLTSVFELAKLFEEKLLIFLADTDARILDLDQESIVALQVRRIDLHETVLISELERIVDQIDHDLFQAHLVTEDERRDGLADPID